ncbi:uncharacterized protein LOC135484044 isoform X2 [Lineus longissimus]|uniref:uncharacterized protein LOC135484044 isoform X2 n=1 Tax=Lineus longissimus TaxID=88925 RepID=UPI002B4CFFF2
MAARQTRPPPQPSGGRDPAIADMSKEEKEEMLNRKMEEIKRKNEAIKKRYEEVEADKRYAEELMKQQGPVEGEEEPTKRSPSARKEMKGQINEERKKRPLSMDVTEAKPSRMSTGRGRKLERMAKEKLRAPEVGAMRQNEEPQLRQEPVRRKERPKSEGWFDQEKIQQAGHQYERSNSGQQYDHSNSDRSNQRHDRGAENRSDRSNPRNEPGSGRIGFDRANSRNEPGSGRINNSRNEPGSGRVDRSNSRNNDHRHERRNAGMRNDQEGADNQARHDPRRNDREFHSSPQDRPGPPHQRGGIREQESEQNPDGPPPDPTFNFLADRSRDPSKAESRDVTRRHPGNFGGVSFGNVRKQIQHEKQRLGRGGSRGPPQSKLELTMRMTGKERAQYLDWKRERHEIDENRIRRQQDQEGEWRREWDHDKLEQQGRKTEPARRPGPPASTSTPRGTVSNRGRGRGRGGNQGGPSNRTRGFSSGSDDGSRSVANQDDNLVIKIENEFFAHHKKSGGQSSGDLKSPGSGMPPSPGFRSEPRSANQRTSPGERTRPVPARGPSGRTSAPKGRGVALKARSEKQRGSPGGIVARGAQPNSDDTVIKVLTFEDNLTHPQPKRNNQKRDRGQQKNTQRTSSQKDSPQSVRESGPVEESKSARELTPEQKRMPLQQRRFSPEQTRDVRHVSPRPEREKIPEETREVTEADSNGVKTPAGAATSREKEEGTPDLYGVHMDEEELQSYQTYLAECREKGDKFLAEYEEDFEEIDYDQYRLKLDVDLCGVVPVSVASPMSDVSGESLSPFMLKTPTGHVKVIDWAAEMDNTYQDSRSSGAFESLNSTNSFAEDAGESAKGDDEGGQEGDVHDDAVQVGDGEDNGVHSGDDDGEDDGDDDEAQEAQYDEEVECDETAGGELDAGVLYDGLEGGEYYVDEEDEEGAEDGDDEFEDAVDDDEEEFYENGEGEVDEAGEAKKVPEETISVVTNETTPVVEQSEGLRDGSQQQEELHLRPSELQETVSDAADVGSAGQPEPQKSATEEDVPDEADAYPDCDQPEDPPMMDAPIESIATGAAVPSSEESKPKTEESISEKEVEMNPTAEEKEKTE